ncbi:MAG: RnfABCDGE type electron transport complex subunit D [Bacilli bacterium]|nr:RnfABCDGE type electron transport complex subunit D [Bacilli bacterium]
MVIAKENAPHLRRKASVTRMMVDVLIALAPTLIFSFVVYWLNTLVFYLISVTVMIGAEFVYVGLRNMMPADGQKHSFKERFIYAYKGKFNQNNVLTAAISAIIFTLIMPAGAPIYAVIIGALAGIVLGKLVFGGLGSNIFNPAAVGMVFAKICFGGQYLEAGLKEVPLGYLPTYTKFITVPDAVAGATPLGGTNGAIYNAVNNMSHYGLKALVLGQVPGTLGEIYVITILIGAIYLLIRRSADIRVMLPYLGLFALLSLVAGLSIFAVDGTTNPIRFTLYYVLTGGVLFGGVFMLTDPVTSPINSPSRIIYAMVAAVSTIFIRLFAALPEGVGFSILIANMIAVVLDHYEWSNPRYTWKKFLAMGLLVVIPALVIFLVIKFGGVYSV